MNGRGKTAATVAYLPGDPWVTASLTDVVISREGRGSVEAAVDARLLAEKFERRADEAVSWT